MKNIYIIVVALFITASLWAQSPDKMSYQAVIRNSANQLVANQKVGMLITILQGSATGTEVYSETQTPTTNANGLVSIEIGGGTGFSSIDWSTGNYFIKTETDPTGGNTYSIIGTTQLLSVPYALYAKTSGTAGTQGPKGDKGDQGIQGAQGIAGVDGKSAYQLWLDAGNTGDMAAYLVAIKGAKGDQGIQGEKGDAGAVGAQGIAGVDGKSAYQLWLDAGNTGDMAAYLVAIKGAKGDQGIQGLTGAVGAVGAQGLIGLTGAVGATGAQGPAGVDGLTTSVNGVTQVGGAITLTKADIGLANVDNTTDANKPISTATQTALNNKVDITSNQTVAGNKTFTGTTTVATPVNATDAATKAYVDALLTQIKSMQDVMIAAGTFKVEDNDGNLYGVVKIGSQVWMAANLKTTTYNDGTAIPNVTDATTWAALTTGAQCDYDNTPANTTTYGKLYNWYAVNTAKLCPKGWHVPSDADWSTLSTTLGGDATSSGALKETGTTHWSSPNTGATNTSGFTALPGGYRDHDGSSIFVGNYSGLWSSTEFSTSYANYRGLSNNSTSLYSYNYFKVNGFSVRCLRN